MAILVLGLVALEPRPASASGCQGAISDYNSAISEISSTMQRYTRCLNASGGRDDCSSEFRRLRSAQSDFESAVISYGASCPE